MSKKGQLTLQISKLEGRDQTCIIYRGPSGKRTIASIQNVEPGSAEWHKFVHEELGPYVNLPRKSEGASAEWLSQMSGE